MKTIIKALFQSLPGITLCATFLLAAPAQSPAKQSARKQVAKQTPIKRPPAKQPETSARDFIKQYHAGKIEGLQVTVFLQQANGLLAPVEPQREFKQGERVKIGIESNFRGYLYVVNLGSSGKQTVIFPDGKEHNLLQPRRRYLLPRSYDLKFDENEGFESLLVFVARQPIPFLAAAIKNPEGELNREQSLAAAALWNDRAPQAAGISPGELAANQSSSQSANQQRGDDSDDGSRDPTWDRKKKTTIVAVPRNKAATGQPQRPDSRISTFGIKLKNKGARP